MTSETVSLITGAGQGIGRAIAKRFASEGHAVVVNDIDGEKAADTVEAIRSKSNRALAVEADIASSTGVDETVDTALAEFSSIDVLVNNAGIQTTGQLTELPESDWDRVLDVNLKGPYLTSQRVANEMIERGIEGDIVNITSIHQDVPRSRRTHYDSSKAGLRMMTKDLALELAAHNINVNCVAPGAIRTPMNDEVLDSNEKTDQLENQIPWGRIGEPEEVAEAVSFLTSERAEYITGSCIRIDGGLSLSGTKTLIS